MLFSLLVCLAGKSEVFSLGTEPFYGEDDSITEEGRFRLSVGFRISDGFKPVGFSERGGSLLEFPVVALRAGLGGNVEMQIESPLYRFFDEGSTAGRSDDFGDIFIWTKVRNAREAPGRPSFGFRVGFKVPSGSDETDIATDETDVFGHFILGKSIKSSRVYCNAGLGILGNPEKGGSQIDVLLITVGLMTAVAPRVTLGLELSSQVEGTDGVDLSEKMMRVGFLYGKNGRGVGISLHGGKKSGENGLGVSVGMIWSLGKKSL